MQTQSQNIAAQQQQNPSLARRQHHHHSHHTTINPQLEQMLTKLRAKVQNEVQLRIENQRKLNQHLQEVGQNVSNNLVEQFEKQVTNLNADVDKFESELKQWEFAMQSELSENNAAITAFNNDVDFSQQTMSQSLNTKFRLTQEYQEKVRERMDALEQTVFKPADQNGLIPNSSIIKDEQTQHAQQTKHHEHSKSQQTQMDETPDQRVAPVEQSPKSLGLSIPQLEKERSDMELDLTSDIMMFNQRVTMQVNELEKQVMGEITGLQEELSKEETRRTENDKKLLMQVNNFILGLQVPQQQTQMTAMPGGKRESRMKSYKVAGNSSTK